MTIKLTPAETDFLGDLLHAEHELWEVFGFIRLHEGKQTDIVVLQAGIAAVSKLSAEGWVKALNHERKKELPHDELRAFLKSLTPQTTYHLEDSPWLVITELGKKRYSELAK